MPIYGYARVSTLDQDLTIQRAALKAAGCGVVRAEKASGSRRDGRTELQVLLDFVQPGDTLVVTRIDRLARSMKDLQDLVHELIEKSVALRATEQLVDTGTEPSPPTIPLAMTSRSRPAPYPLCSRRVRRTHSWYERALASPQAPYWHGTLLLNVCVTFDLDSGTSGEAIDTNCHPNR